MLPIENADYFLRYMELPSKIYALVMENEDGTFTMILDPRRSREQQIDDYEHELWHIIRDDLYSCKPIEEVENG